MSQKQINPRKALLYSLAGVFLLSTALLFEASQSPFFPLVSFFTVSVLWSWLLLRGRSVSPHLWEGLFAFCLVAIALRHYLSRQLLLLTLGEFLYLIQGVRLLQVQNNYLDSQSISPRNVLQVYVIAMVHLAVLAISSASFSFALYFLLLVLLVPFVFLPLYLQQGDNLLLPWKAFVGLVALVSTLLFLCVSLLFLLLPRPPDGKWRRLGQSRIHLSGFSPKVELDDLSYLLPNEQVVLRVKVKGPIPPTIPPLLRGMTYTSYANRHWRRHPRSHSQPLSKGVAYLSPPPEGKGTSVELEIYQLPLSSATLFTLPGTYRLELISPKLPALMTSFDQTFWLPRPLARFLRYRLSVSPQPSRYLSGSLDIYREFPKELSWEKFRNLALSIVSDPFDSALAAEEISQYLKRTCAYTLDLSSFSTSSRDPVEEFLFQKKAGHCELFASAMMLLLRSLQIPCRLVNGFRLEEYNDVGKYYIVRQKHAHAWVEVWTGEEWLTYDPTASRQFSTPVSWWRKSPWVDYVEMQWNQWVVLYDATSQRELYRRLWGVGGQLLGWLGRQMNLSLPSAVGGGAVGWLFLPLLLGGLLGVAWLLRRRRRRWPKRRYPSLPEWMVELVQTFEEKVEVSLSESQSLGEFFQKVSQRVPHLEEKLGELLLHYYAFRFGGEEKESAERLARELLQKTS